MGYVYFARFGDLTKIGYTTVQPYPMCVKQRLYRTAKQYNLGRYELLFSLHTPEARRLEQHYHTLFAPKRIKLELFELEPGDLEQAKQLSNFAGLPVLFLSGKDRHKAFPTPLPERIQRPDPTLIAPLQINQDTAHRGLNPLQEGQATPAAALQVAEALSTILSPLEARLIKLETRRFDLQSFAVGVIVGLLFVLVFIGVAWVFTSR